MRRLLKPQQAINYECNKGSLETEYLLELKYFVQNVHRHQDIIPGTYLRKVFNSVLVFSYWLDFHDCKTSHVTHDKLIVYSCPTVFMTHAIFNTWTRPKEKLGSWLTTSMRQVAAGKTSYHMHYGTVASRADSNTTQALVSVSQNS
jgi:hypothetical protein